VTVQLLPPERLCSACSVLNRTMRCGNHTPWPAVAGRKFHRLTILSSGDISRVDARKPSTANSQNQYEKYLFWILNAAASRCGTRQECAPPRRFVSPPSAE